VGGIDGLAHAGVEAVVAVMDEGDLLGEAAR
jgi:hypothetical protein